MHAGLNTICANEKHEVAQYDALRWVAPEDGGRLRAWQLGLTGYPLVDAAMTQLCAFHI